MKGLNLSEEELASMNYNDVAYVILEKNSKMKFIDLFNALVKVMNLEESDSEKHLTDFFELLSTDKRFTMLDGGLWDLKVRHDKGMIALDDEDEEEEETLEEEDEEETDEDSFDESNDDDDVEEDDLKDLVIIDDSEEELS